MIKVIQGGRTTKNSHSLPKKCCVKNCFLLSLMEIGKVIVIYKFRLILLWAFKWLKPAIFVLALKWCWNIVYMNSCVIFFELLFIFWAQTFSTLVFRDEILGSAQQLDRDFFHNAEHKTAIMNLEEVSLTCGRGQS